MTYIKRETLIESIGYIPEGVISEYDAGRWDVMQKIKEAPAADVVEVVRCKDCIYRHSPDCSLWYGSVGDIDYIREMSDNFYCSCGERNEE